MGTPGPARQVDVPFSDVAKRNVAEFPEVKELIKSRARELAVPGAAEQLGHQLHGVLRTCRTIKLGSHHRMIFMVRTDDVVVVAIGLRRNEAAYVPPLVR